jgi:glyoxylase-like metal-dependent hydrolase (beta-lactamase superfamily II)
MTVPALIQPGDRAYGPVTVLGGAEGGRYPDGNSMVVSGADQCLLLDPSLTVFQRGHQLLASAPGGAGDGPSPAAEGIDTVVLSHVHEDHIPGLGHFGQRPVAVHEEDQPALHSLDGLLAAYGYPAVGNEWTDELINDFHVSFRPDAATYADGQCWDLGGGVTMTAVHLPGHTAGHCGLLIEPVGFFYLGDIELTGFGPFYGDASSDLDRFEVSLARCREVHARWYGTFHHKGVIEGREAFLRELDAFAAVIGRRDDAIVAHLDEPRTLDDLARHRFLYRPHVEAPYVFDVERRSAAMHVAKLLRQGRIVEVEPGRYQRA